MKEVLLGLLLWIGQNTSLVPEDHTVLPDVRSVEFHELAGLLFNGKIPAYLSATDLDKMIGQVEAIYYPPTKTIYVRKGLDLDSVHGRSALVHELIHFIQYQQGVDRQVPCINALENEAYRVQAIYMRQNGEQPEFDDFTVATRGLCDA